MTEAQQKANAKKFKEYWTNEDRGDEKSDTYAFWLSLLRDVFGVERPEEHIVREKRVKANSTRFIDIWLPDTKVLIEQKSKNVDLTQKYERNGKKVTPYEQAKSYDNDLPYNEKARWIVTCNFKEFRVYDMAEYSADKLKAIIELKDFEKYFYRLSFLVKEQKEIENKELDISIKAGAFVGLIYDKLKVQYHDFDTEKAQKSLNVLCVRLVFCLYAEDAGLFGEHNLFTNYLNEFSPSHMRKALVDLFKILDQKEEKRGPYLADDNPLLAKFPYVNGGLFQDEDIEIPPFTDELKDLLVNKAGKNFDWSEISPTIFGAVFESTLNPETRRSGGMHYTSIENIHKVIDPLFLTDLKNRLNEIKAKTDVGGARTQALNKFRDKLATLRFLDPACGSGNFLTETYLSLRRLENEALNELQAGQILFEAVKGDPIKVSINQFYGIEINDFAVSVAKTALWIAEDQMLRETQDIIKSELNFLPLTTNAHIHEGNALRMDWSTVVKKGELNYIMGNPPFSGGMFTKGEKSRDLEIAFPECEKVGEADYVTGWFAKSVKFTLNTTVRCALVSTNSICQGQAVSCVWKPLFEMGAHIDFAYKTFRWDSEASLKAHVHCVIVGFSTAKSKKEKILFEDNKQTVVKNINGYLSEGENVFIESRSTPLCNVPKMRFGSMPIDGGNFILTEEEKNRLIETEPLAEKWVRLFLGANEFIKNKKRYCLWLVDASPKEIRECKEVKRRVEAVQQFRFNSKSSSTRKKALSSTLFAAIAQPDTEYILVPRVSSERRKYIPMGFVNKNVIASDATQIIPNATIYDFGVLTSSVHMAWMRVVCGRLKSDYRYSKDIVYNNFIWPTPTDEQKRKLKKRRRVFWTQGLCRNMPIAL